MGSAIKRLYTIQSRSFGKNMKKKIEFKTHEAWFKAQFKQLPIPGNAYAKLRDESETAEDILVGLKSRLRFQDQLAATFTATHYVWYMAQAGDIPKLKTKRK